MLTAKGGDGRAQQALADFFPQLQFECWKSPEPNIHVYKKKFPLPEPVFQVFEACQPASKDADGAALKRGLT